MLCFLDCNFVTKEQVELKKHFVEHSMEKQLEVFECFLPNCIFNTCSFEERRNHLCYSRKFVSACCFKEFPSHQQYCAKIHIVVFSQLFIGFILHLTFSNSQSQILQ